MVAVQLWRICTDQLLHGLADQNLMISRRKNCRTRLKDWCKGLVQRFNLSEEDDLNVEEPAFVASKTSKSSNISSILTYPEGGNSKGSDITDLSRLDVVVEGFIGEAPAWRNGEPWKRYEKYLPPTLNLMRSSVWGLEDFLLKKPTAAHLTSSPIATLPPTFSSCTVVHPSSREPRKSGAPQRSRSGVGASSPTR
ncbi:hypothetical protein FF1_003427 [Malus domestica]